MSDIPIGSPPVPPGRHAAPSGWYPDPVDAAQERYWDGWQWSRNTRPSERRGGAPVQPQSPYGQPPYGQAPYGQSPYGQSPYGQSPQPNPYGQASPGQGPDQQSPYPPQPYVPPPYPGGYPAAGAKQAWTADGVPLSGWWWRVLAMLIDGLIVGIIAGLLSSPIYARLFGRFAEWFNEIVAAAEAGLPPPPQPSPTTLVPFTDQLILTAVALVVEAVYIVLFLRWRSATPGKLICGLRVVPVDQGRYPGPLAWNTIVIRTAIWVLPNLSTLLLIFRLLDALFPLWQPKRQAIHDLAAKTQVVKIR